MNRSVITKWYCTSVIGYFISSIPVFLIPFSTGSDTWNNVIGVLAGLLFWLGLLIGTGTYGIIWKHMRVGQYDIKVRKYKPACITFFTKPIAFVSDIVLISAGVLLILGNTVFEFKNVIYLFFMFAFIFTFLIHFLFNGKIFKYVFLDYKRGE